MKSLILPLTTITTLAGAGLLAAFRGQLGHAFMRGYGCADLQACKDKKMRDRLSEAQIDEMINDSFPASDPPSTY